MSLKQETPLIYYWKLLENNLIDLVHKYVLMFLFFVSVFCELIILFDVKSDPAYPK